MPEWPVYVDGWQLECCGDPFAVGDEVEWTLTLVPGHPMRQELLVDFSGEVEAPASDYERSGYVVRSGGVRVFVEDATAVDRRFETRGLISEEHHGGIPDAVPPTRGRVRRIQLVTTLYVRAADRTWTPKPGEDELHDLTHSPAQFTELDTTPELRTSQTGLLVLLEVDPEADEA